MNVEVKFKVGLHGVYNRKLLFFVSLLFVSVLIFSGVVSAFNDTSLFAVGAADKVVSNEFELRNAIDDIGSQVIIALGNDIQLTGPLIIPAYKVVTLVSNNPSGFYKLIGAAGQATISLGVVDGYEHGGVLMLDGIIVTHAIGDSGSGVVINSGGVVLYSGEVSGNADYGVYNTGGNFSMFGGVISNNKISGVYNSNYFIMTNGTISNNGATTSSAGVINTNSGWFNLCDGAISNNIGVGVYNSGGDFTMSGGVIDSNVARNFGAGGGVTNGGNFILSGGEISNNSADTCGGVSNSENCRFVMSGGKIFGNRAEHSGGGVFNGGFFELSGGEISGNTVTSTGGGVVNIGNFSMLGGEISGNTAQEGGGVYIGNVFSNRGFFELLGGKVVDNTALNNGGGIWVDAERLDYLFVGDGVVFSNNRASTAYNRNAIHDVMYAKQISTNVVWTTPFIQGYNNYDISYTGGTTIDIGNGNGSNSNNNNNNGSDSDGGGIFDTGGMWSGLFTYNAFIGALLVVVIIILIIVAVFLFQKVRR